VYNTDLVKLPRPALSVCVCVCDFVTGASVRLGARGAHRVVLYDCFLLFCVQCVCAAFCCLRVNSAPPLTCRLVYQLVICGPLNRADRRVFVK